MSECPHIPDPVPHLGEPRWPNGLRPELPPLPANIARLPRHRGYPVPWFVDRTNIAGDPDFRVADGRRFVEAIRKGLCWVCGQSLRRPAAFLVGPMCAVNRISAEPPSHIECAEWSAIGCPFLSRPHMDRREAGMPEGAVNPGGLMITRNPGVSILWVTSSFRVVSDPGSRGYLIEMGRPRRVSAYASGRAATPDEVRASFESGLPLLGAVAEEEGEEALAALARQAEQASALLGIARGRRRAVPHG